jgi:hypothetical protein
MNINKKMAPLLLAFLMLVPIGAIAGGTSTYSGSDQSTLSYSGTASWDQSINQHLSNVPVGNNFAWYNQFHNAGDIVRHPILVATSTANGNVDKYSLPNLGPYSYTSNFLWTTSTVTAGSGWAALGVVHQYDTNGPSVRNDQQTYN